MKTRNGILVFFLLILYTISYSQQMPLPVQYQFQLMMKVLAYEGRLNADPNASINIALLFTGDPKSQKVKNDLKAIYDKTPIKAIGEKQLNIIEYKYKNTTDFANFVKSNNINVVYITPGMDSFLKELKEFTIQNNLVAITGVPEYVNNHFIMVGLNVFNKKPKIMVNLEIAKSAGAKFSADLLKLCQVIRE